jgi:hypothetical protein
MVGAHLATEFWAAVEDCLVTFHQVSPPEAAQKVTRLWRRLADLTPSQESDNAEMPAFDDMIYHEEPWYIACNLVDCDKGLEPYRIAYEQILKQNHLV